VLFTSYQCIIDAVASQRAYLNTSPAVQDPHLFGHFIRAPLQTGWRTDRKEAGNTMSSAVNWMVPNGKCIPARPAHIAPSFIKPLRKEPLSPVRFGGVLWRGLTHLGTHRDVLRLIVKFPLLTQLAQDNLRFASKYLTRDYLVQNFSVTQRASSFLHHYTRLHELVPHYLLRQMLEEEVMLHQIVEGPNRFALTLGLSRPYDNQGELSLRLRVDGEIVYVVSFTIVPGSVVKSEAAEILLITRIQGIKGCRNQIALATKTLHDVAPARILLAALQGIADAFGIRAMAAVSGVLQSSYRKNSAVAFKKAYDDFFTELGISKNTAGFFSTPVPIEQKPLASIKRGHRVRTKQKRAFKRQIQSACAAFFAPAPSPEPSA
jgi:uncharacterized protein